MNSSYEISVKNDGGNISLESEISLLNTQDFEAKVKLPIYFDINDRVDELKNKTGVTTDTVKSEAEKIVADILKKIFENGYIQAPDTQSPSIAFKDILPLHTKTINKVKYQEKWEEVGYFEANYKTQDGSDYKKFTVWKIAEKEINQPGQGGPVLPPNEPGKPALPG